MASFIDTRRYLTNFDAKRTGNILTDVLVIGSGVAGLRAAIEASRYGNVIVATKQSALDSATTWAQGGIASALSSDDSTSIHFEDTVRVGCKLNNRSAVATLVEEGPDRVRELLDWGMKVDKSGDQVALGREAGHSLSRIVHAGGDRTGAAVSETLLGRARSLGNIRFFEHCFVVDLLTVDGVCHGAVAFHGKHGHQLIWARRTIVAAGGCGQLWRETTNPPVCTGDGIAAAFRAGAVLANMEFVQFHPTTLYVAGAGRALISEAVRGEGAWLVDRAGDRFMTRFHADGELAPRDVVSRAIHTHLHETRGNCVYLDVRHISGFAERFPHIARLCSDFQIDVARELIPVRPSAHYLIGGVVSDKNGLTNIAGLIACGEAASTGVHGANRLASNSLLEGLVYGMRAGRAAGDSGDVAASVHPIANTTPASARTMLDLVDIRNSLRSLMWRNVGIVRHGDRLRETCEILDLWANFTLDKTFDDEGGWSIQNMLTTARLISACAGHRTDSIGVHFRADSESHPTASTTCTQIQRNEEGTDPVGIEIT